MRITNSMVTANTKSNININKMYHDKANTQVASGQKIQRPSDDPVIAIRALRLNTSLSELDQFKQKNIPDAEAWFKATETALDQTDSIIADIQEKLNQAVSQENSIQSVKDVIEELKQLKTQIYATGNAENAGRTVFTGYRTSEMLTFTEPEQVKYCMYEPISALDIEPMQYVAGKQDFDKNSPPNTGYTEQSISMNNLNRIRLAYDDLDGTTPTIGTMDANGNLVSIGISPTVQSITGLTPAQLDNVYSGNTTVFIPETGELILSDTDKQKMVAAQDAGQKLNIYYEKSSWQKGDLRPEHYFMCKTPGVTSLPLYPNGIEYNYNRVDADGKPSTKPTDRVQGFMEQEMVYEIAFNQSIQINSHANDVYKHGMGRDIDDLVDIVALVSDAEQKVKVLEEKYNSLPEGNPDKPEYEKNMIAANKEYTFLKEKMHSMFQAAQKAYAGYSNTVNKEISRVGAMTARLALTKNRVEDQYFNVEELADKNINIDIDEVGLDYTNAKIALEAARLAAGQIAESTLLNYI